MRLGLRSDLFRSRAGPAAKRLDSTSAREEAGAQSLWDAAVADACSVEILKCSYLRYVRTSGRSSTSATCSGVGGAEGKNVPLPAHRSRLDRGSMGRPGQPTASPVFQGRGPNGRTNGRGPINGGANRRMEYDGVAVEAQMRDEVSMYRVPESQDAESRVM